MYSVYSIRRRAYIGRRRTGQDVHVPRTILRYGVANVRCVDRPKPTSYRRDGYRSDVRAGMSARVEIYQLVKRARRRRPYNATRFLRVFVDQSADVHETPEFFGE